MIRSQDALPLLSGLLGTLIAATAPADCNCQSDPGAVDHGTLPMAAAPHFAPPSPHAAMPRSRRPISPEFWRVPVPPGTLGRTYRLCSRPLPPDEHPRNAGLEIRTHGTSEIYIEGMEGYVDEDGFWQFTTEKPLLPTQPPIVRVILTRGGLGQPTKDVRMVRLIPGRTLSVEF